MDGGVGCKTPCHRVAPLVLGSSTHVPSLSHLSSSLVSGGVELGLVQRNRETLVHDILCISKSHEIIFKTLNPFFEEF